LEKDELSCEETAKILGLSKRQVRRLRVRLRKKPGDDLRHGNRGKRPKNRLAEGLRKQVVALARKKYAGFNDSHLTEKLRDEEKLKISRASVQRLLRGAAIVAVCKHRAAKHRRRRERKPQAGLMMQWDGSRHDWLEGRGPILSLMGAVDDATGELLPGAHFVEQESAAGYLTVLKAIAKEKGLPWAVYQDRHGALKRNDDHWTLEEELKGEQALTQVGKALRELGIEAIFAQSPQAKGRVERQWSTQQDRLTSELRLAKASTRQAANEVLDRVRPKFNQWFAKPPRDAKPAWRPVHKGTDLERICSLRYEATVGNDNAVRIGGQIFDIPPGPSRSTYAKTKVEVCQLLDGSWRIYEDNVLLATAPKTEVGELRTLKRRKRPAASRVFRKALQTIRAAS
jgi:transposase